MKRKFQKTTGPEPKVPSVYNLRSKDPITEGAKDPRGYNLRSKVQKTEGQYASTIIQKKKTLKKDGSKDSSVAKQKGIQKTELQRTRPPKSSAPPYNKIETTKRLTTSLASLDKKDQPLTSEYEPYISEPMYHIRWEDGDMENGPLGQNCILCNKDLSGATEDDDSEDNDDLQYEDDDDDDEYGYYDDLNPPLFPAVDILACGHAYHTECLQKGTPEEHSSDPLCTFCSKMA